MKHGPIALVQEGFPVVAVVPDGPTRDKLIGNLMEVRARGATVLAVAEEGVDGLEHVANLVLPLPPGCRCCSPWWRWCRCRCSPTTLRWNSASISTSRAISPKASP